MLRLTDHAHQICDEILEEGDVAIDATVGNGHDTLFLAEAVGAEGRVYGFDVQADALNLTRQKLGEELLLRVTLLHKSHAEMDQHIESSDRGCIKVIMFNLGYLPGGDKEITTMTESTLVAMEAACKLLHPEGVITILAYPGHETGHDETKAVVEFLNTMDRERWELKTIEAQVPFNTPLTAPYFRMA